MRCQVSNRALCRSSISCSVKPRTVADKSIKVDDYFYCSKAFGQPKLQIIKEQKVDAALRLPLLHKTPCCANVLIFNLGVYNLDI